MSELSIRGVHLAHKFREGDDVAAITLNAIGVDLRDGDIVTITSKIVAKAEGRVIHAADREDAITAESVRTLATRSHARGLTRIVQTRHGLILAAAGVDASNTEDGTVVLLPEDSDASACAIRSHIQTHRGINVGVVITDTLGRAWRLGVTDHAIGCAGIQVIDDLTGETDAFGRELEMTMVAIADELAAASELVRAKNSMTPIAVIRGASGWVTPDDGPGALALIRPDHEDMFSLGTREAMEHGAQQAVLQRRTMRTFEDSEVPRDVIERSIAAAITAPAPHHTQPWRFLIMERGVDDQRRTNLLDAMSKQWKSDLSAEGKPAEEIDRRIAPGNILRTAPAIIFAFMDLTNAVHTYPEEDGRNVSERDMFLIAGGAAVENILVSLAAEGYGSAWISSSIFCPEVMRAELGLSHNVWALGAIAVGKPASEASERPQREISDFLL